MEKDKNKAQWLLFGSILSAGVLLILVGVLLNPNAVTPTLNILSKAWGGLIFLVVWIIMLLGSGVVGLVARWLINMIDEKVAYDLDIPTWGHWLIALLFGVGMGFV